MLFPPSGRHAVLTGNMTTFHLGMLCEYHEYAQWEHQVFPFGKAAVPIGNTECPFRNALCSGKENSKWNGTFQVLKCSLSSICLFLPTVWGIAVESNIDNFHLLLLRREENGVFGCRPLLGLGLGRFICLNRKIANDERRNLQSISHSKTLQFYLIFFLNLIDSSGSQPGEIRLKIERL